MFFSTITFRKSGLQDETPSTALNSVTGLNCARWFISRLPGFEGATFDKEPVAEDWGYAVCVRMGDDTLTLGFGGIFEDLVADRWRIVVGDNFVRGLFPWTRARRRAAAERLSAFVEQTLRSTEGVTEIEVELD